MDGQVASAKIFTAANVVFGARTYLNLIPSIK